ncbi:MAG: hypothetical protein WC551_01670 [Patescibacteria group bacterium]
MPFESPSRNNQETDWERTKMAEIRLRAAGKFVPPRVGDRRAPYGYFSGRPIIGSGMGNINGGVYLGVNAREAVVVDDNREKPGGETLQALYSEIVLPKIDRAAKKYGRNPKDVAIAVIFNVVTEVLPYDKEKSEALIQQLTNGRSDGKVHLASFLNFGAGVCRHQALLVAYLIEKLMQEDNPAYRLNGQLSIERNKVALTNENLAGAHAWVRYTSTSGEIRIIDIAQKRCGRLEKLINEPGAWEYARPEDLKRLKNQHNPGYSAGAASVIP